MSWRAYHRPEAVEVVRVHAFVRLTDRKAVRIATVRENGRQVVELRGCGLTPRWRPTEKDHRLVLRGQALGIIRAALEAAEAGMGERS